MSVDEQRDQQKFHRPTSPFAELRPEGRGTHRARRMNGRTRRMAASVSSLFMALLIALTPRGAAPFRTVLSLGAAASRPPSTLPSARRHRPSPSTTVDIRGRGCRGGPTSLHMFMGSDGGILGIGGPELFTILLVGYFVLGPSDLYKLTKEIGKFIQNVRTLGSDLSTTFESNMESSLQLEELRKAQRELNDAFSFRRSINVDEDSEAFSVAAGSAQQAEEAAAAAAAPAEGEGGATKKRKIRRRVKRKPAPEVGAVPDLEMPAAASPETVATETKTVAAEPATRETTAEEIAKIEKEFDRFTNRTAEEEAEIEKEFAQYTEVSPAVAKAEQSRFQQQLSGNWNEQVLANEDKLEPIALVMNKIALLEKEKRAAQTRLEEEFEKRKELEEKYYEEQRSLLEEAAVQIQDAAFGLDSSKKV